VPKISEVYYFTFAFLKKNIYFCKIKHSKQRHKMRKEIGKWFMDIAKYVATAILISSFLGSLEQKWIVYSIGSLIVFVCFSVGLYFIHNKK